MSSAPSAGCRVGDAADEAAQTKLHSQLAVAERDTAAATACGHLTKVPFGGGSKDADALFNGTTGAA